MGVKTKSQNSNFRRAKREKNDEFYTQLVDIENEIQHYTKHFNGKIVLCNCDGEDSKFVKYFTDNFDRLGLKELLTHSKDFKSIPCVKLLEQADIVVTNPPFSLFRDYVSQLMRYNKKFLILGNMGAVGYKEIFPLIKSNKIWLGVSPRSMDFIRPDGSVTNVNATWYTNLKHAKRNDEIILTEKYTKAKYPKYDNYDAIEVDAVANIPKDYKGVMGVPITLLEKYNPKQFEIIGIDYDVKEGNLSELVNPNWTGKMDKGYVRGKRKYYRILIRNKEYA